MFSHSNDLMFPERKILWTCSIKRVNSFHPFLIQVVFNHGGWWWWRSNRPGASHGRWGKGGGTRRGGSGSCEDARGFSSHCVLLGLWDHTAWNRSKPVMRSKKKWAITTGSGRGDEHTHEFLRAGKTVRKCTSRFTRRTRGRRWRSGRGRRFVAVGWPFTGELADLWASSSYLGILWPFADRRDVICASYVLRNASSTEGGGGHAWMSCSEWWGSSIGVAVGGRVGVVMIRLWEEVRSRAEVLEWSETVLVMFMIRRVLGSHSKQSTRGTEPHPKLSRRLPGDQGRWSGIGS